MSVNWSVDERELLEIVRETMSTREIQRFFQLLGYDRSKDSIQKQSKRMGLRFEGYGLLDEITFGEDDERTQAAYSRVITERHTLAEQVSPAPVATSAEQSSRTREYKAAALDMLAELKKIRTEVPRTCSLSTDRISSSKNSLVVVLSDWHMGQVVIDPESNDVLYNTDIARARITGLPRNLQDQLYADQIEDIDECVLLMCGDMVTGEGVFPGQEWSTEASAATQVLQATKAAWQMIQGFRSMFPFVRIVTARGNHGAAGGSPESNWDNIVYQQLELLVDLTGEPNLTIHNRYTDYSTVTIKGWRGLIRHTAPIQADTASAIAKFAGWYGIHDWDFMCYGHYHHWGVLPWMGKPIIRNGCLVGGDDYAEGLARKDGPSQVAFTVNEERIANLIIPLCY